jgi:tRNA dimethylallyltransferase
MYEKDRPKSRNFYSKFEMFRILLTTMIPHNLLVILGPTATGKTRLAVALALEQGGEIISADSRQVYRGLDIGAGKDLDEYTVNDKKVPYHLIDEVLLDQEFSVFDFQKRFYEVFHKLSARNVLPVLVGGSGLYLESVLMEYNLAAVPGNPTLRSELSDLSFEELKERLAQIKRLHNVSDFGSPERVIRAIEIATFQRNHPAEVRPALSPLIFGIRVEHQVLRQHIHDRLHKRLNQGLIAEVEQLIKRGVSHERLDSLGLEYRYVTRLLNGTIKSQDDLAQKLEQAIYHFARRQESWFRRMERKGIRIQWLEGADIISARAIINKHETVT